MEALLEATVIDMNDQTASRSVGFTFREANLYADFYSYAARALADSDGTALTNHETLGKLSSTVFSLFFQAWISTPNSYDNSYWIWQPNNATLPFGLDFEAIETVSTVKTLTFTTEQCAPGVTGNCPVVTEFLTTKTTTVVTTGYPRKFLLNIGVSKFQC
jgi:hypothetical protein